MRSTIVFAAMFAAAIVVVDAAEAKLKRLTVGTNPAGSTYFLLGGGFAKLFQEKLAIRSTAQPHAGSSVYLPLMNKGELTLGLNSSLDSGLAFNGRKPFKRPTKQVRSLARIWILPYAYMVRANSGIRRVEDLRGKRVIINIKTNPSLAQLNATILRTAGLSSADVSPVDSGGVVSGINMVVEGRADAAPVALAMPALRKAHATVPGGVGIVALGGEASDTLMTEGMPGSRTFTAKPSKRYPFLKNATQIAAFDTYLNAGTTVTNEDAYMLVKTVHSNWAKMQKDYPPLRGVKAEWLAPDNNPLPYHPGAVRYYKEVGLWTAANDKRQSMLK